MFLLVLAYPGCPGQNSESHTQNVCMCVYMIDGIMSEGHCYSSAVEESTLQLAIY